MSSHATHQCRCSCSENRPPDSGCCCDQERCACGCQCGCSCSCHVQCECACHRGGCCCGHHGAEGFQRRFINRAERIAQLEKYLEELRAEVQGVEEAIADLRDA